MSRLWLLSLALPLWILTGCSDPTGPAPLGEAFVGPATLKLRKELGPQAPDGPTVHHGERVEIVQTRRRFARIRTGNGAEGWTDMHQLLASAQMEALDELAGRAAKLPSQGAATVYEGLNVHTEPNRQAPSFYRIAKGESVDVVAHELAPRVPFDPPGVLPERPKVRVRKPRKEKESGLKVPRPPAPGLPKNWLELSKTPVIPDLPPEPPPPPPRPVPNDDWTLVRLRTGRAGWVLTGMLRMNIPDEVAQYSEGHRITSYFSMADVNDNGQIRHQWLWTTLSNTLVPYEFDSFRYFIWNIRHHRYETAYVERNVKGFYPITVHPVTTTAGKKQETYPGFSLIVEGDDGARYRKDYIYEIYRVRLINTVKLEPPAAPQKPGTEAAAEAAPAPAPEEPLYKRLMKRISDLRHRWTGK